MDPGLATIIERWPTLPDQVRQAIVAMVEVSGSRDCDGGAIHRR
jgi:hypothetical protein